MTSFAELARPSGPWVHQTDRSEAEEILSAADDADVLLVQLDGFRMHTLEELFRGYVREFSFPEYFGWNWAAFSECMRDLAWLPSRAYLTVIFHSDQVLSAEPEETATYMRQLDNIGRRWAGAFALGPDWGGGEVPFHTVFV